MTVDFHPTELWNFTTRDGRHVRAILLPRGLEVTLAWLVNNHIEGSEDFAEAQAAMRRAEELRVAFER